MATMTDSGKDTNRHSERFSPELNPNGGLIAWLQVVGSFMAFLNTWYSPFL